MTNPPICILTMSYDPRNRVRAVKEAACQTYPAVLKTLFMMYGAPDIALGEDLSPKHMKFELNFTIKECNVKFEYDDGYKWWMKKMMEFVKQARLSFPNVDPLCAIMDEDDGFENDYLELAVESIRKHNCKAVWNYTNMNVTRSGFKIAKYREPVGTTVAFLSVFEDVTARAASRYPSLQNGKHDPLDAKWRGIMQQIYKPRSHPGIRYRVEWSGSSTRRKKTEEIDYVS